MEELPSAGDWAHEAFEAACLKFSSLFHFDSVLIPPPPPIPSINAPNN